MPKYNLEDVATIEVPPAMELQSQAYRQQAQSYYDQHQFIPVPGRAVFQQDGVNGHDKEAMALYVRIIHETKRGSPGNYPQVGVAPEISPQELEEINHSMNKKMMRPQLMGMKVVNWFGVDIIKLNGQYAMHLAYERQMGENPVVRVDRYNFFNHDKLQVLTLSYRLAEASRWEKVLEHALNSYRIIR